MPSRLASVIQIQRLKGAGRQGQLCAGALAALELMDIGENSEQTCILMRIIFNPLNAGVAKGFERDEDALLRQLEFPLSGT